MTLMGVAIIYAKTHLRILLNQKYGIVLSQFWRFLNDDTHRKSNSNVSNSNFGRGYIILALSALRPPLRVLASINEVKEVLIHIRFTIGHRYQECALHRK